MAMVMTAKRAERLAALAAGKFAHNPYTEFGGAESFALRCIDNALTASRANVPAGASTVSSACIVQAEIRQALAALQWLKTSKGN